LLSNIGVGSCIIFMSKILGLILADGGRSSFESSRVAFTRLDSHKVKQL